MLTESLANKKFVPVFLTQDQINLYYNGFSNDVLWPLFHSLPLHHKFNDHEPTYKMVTQFEEYLKVNQIFAQVVADHYREVVWIQDYHLMVVPKNLKKINPEMGIRWFLHNAFPVNIILRSLNADAREHLLRSVLHADMVGLQSNEFAENFVSSCSSFMRLKRTPTGVEHDDGKVTRVTVVPIGISPQRFLEGVKLPHVKRWIDTLKVETGNGGIFSTLYRAIKGKKIILGIDRLDMIKGIPHRLLAFEHFLLKNPDWQDKVVFIQVGVPSRTDVPECMIYYSVCFYYCNLITIQCEIDTYKK